MTKVLTKHHDKNIFVDIASNVSPGQTIRVSCKKLSINSLINWSLLPPEAKEYINFQWYDKRKWILF